MNHLSSLLENHILSTQSKVDTFIEALLKKKSDIPVLLSQALDYVLLGKGKRFRACLVLATGSLLDNCIDLVPLAAAIELIHTYSLVHDDLPAMDGAFLRRGTPSCHVQFGEHIAILVGDTLIPLAFEVILSELTDATLGQRGSLCLALAKAIGGQGMVAGQVLDILGPFPEEEKDLLHLQDLKTGALIQFCIKGPLLVSTCKPEEAQALKIFSLNLGRAFQIADDLLDLKESDQTGKDQGKDSNKITWVTMKGPQEAKKILDHYCKKALENLEIFQERSTLFKEILFFCQDRTS